MTPPLFLKKDAIKDDFYYADSSIKVNNMLLLINNYCRKTFQGETDRNRQRQIDRQTFERKSKHGVCCSIYIFTCNRELA